MDPRSGRMPARTVTPANSSEKIPAEEHLLGDATLREQAGKEEEPP